MLRRGGMWEIRVMSDGSRRRKEAEPSLENPPPYLGGYRSFSTFLAFTLSPTWFGKSVFGPIRQSGRQSERQSALASIRRIAGHSSATLASTSLSVHTGSTSWKYRKTSNDENPGRHYGRQRLALRPAVARQPRPATARSSCCFEPLCACCNCRGTAWRIASAARNQIARVEKQECPLC